MEFLGCLARCMFLAEMIITVLLESTDSAAKHSIKDTQKFIELFD